MIIDLKTEKDRRTPSRAVSVEQAIAAIDANPEVSGELLDRLRQVLCKSGLDQAAIVLLGRAIPGSVCS
jgi:hypothetical protein